MALSHSPSTVTNGLVLALDPANKKSYSQNEFQYSTDIFAWCGSTGHNSSTISRGTISSPVGTTPLQMAVTGTDPHIDTFNVDGNNVDTYDNVTTTSRYSTSRYCNDVIIGIFLI